MRVMPNLPDLMTPGEVALVLRVSPKTVSRWCKQGRVQHCLTAGGHRRIPRSEVERLLNPVAYPDEEPAREPAEA